MKLYNNPLTKKVCWSWATAMTITAKIGPVSHANDMPLKTIVCVFLLLHVYIKSPMNLLHTVNIILFVFCFLF